jgi:hypothetical protein
LTRHLVRPAVAAVALLALVSACSSGGSTQTGASPPTPTTTAPSARSSASPPGDLPGLNTGPAPWPAETAHLQARLAALGLPALGPEATTVHFHVNLVVYVHGHQVQVPYALGIDLRRLQLAEIHTHSASGTIHIEAAQPRRFTLGMVFDVWGVRFTPDCLGGYCRNGADRIRTFVSGHPFDGDPTQLELGDGQVIVVAFGTRDELPDPMPARFAYEGPPQP